MTALAISTRTIPAHPLGIPFDGRPRYGMTPEQAHVYRWLVKNRPHEGVFNVNFRELQRCMMTPSHVRIFERVTALVERGRLAREDAGYRFIRPVMLFKEPGG